MNRYRMFFVQTSTLHACITNLPNMEGFVSTTTNSLPKLTLN
jgi:hypothetical protein